ncbi:uncharacterized protein N7484_003140 [Penicillium longicatenatum]|uniref:uncharacterized protein n=1 Tax=Penicillium longicatenatum TaxID=1561947 RepID=UPI002546D387|nr:uncharacterized protein N7484_003140 [Penicillium longicatenatum]KAJ5649417.1 hypothetical protein N7484_003140 [Penicillium longicatenatum]
MFVRSILLGGAAALGASAMLVVPEMEAQMDNKQMKSIEDDFVNIMQPAYADVSFAVMLKCDECPFREVNKEGVVSWTEDKPSSLFVEFHVEDNRLLANDQQIFPPVPPGPITANQLARDGDEESSPIPVGYALEVMPHPRPADAQDADMLDVRFTILDLEAHPVPVDTVAITLILTPTGDLFLADGDIEKSTPRHEKLSWKKCHGKPKCLQELLFSRIHGLLSSAKDRVMGIAGMKGCKGMKGMGGHHKHHGDFDPEGEKGPHHKHHDDFDPEGLMPPPPPFEDFEDFGAYKAEHSWPDHHGFNAEDAEGRPPRPHHMHGPPHGAFAHTFSRVVRFIVVPAILGVLAGLTASAVGMLVGQAIIFLWQRYRGTKKQEHKAAWEEGNSCEKQGLMTESTEEYLPEYTEESSQTRGSMDKN